MILQMYKHLHNDAADLLLPADLSSFCEKKKMFYL